MLLLATDVNKWPLERGQIKHMVQLDPEDFRHLVRILEKLPRLQTRRDRELILVEAGLGGIIPQIDLEGAPYLVVSDIVNRLQSYGRLPFGYESLGAFLNVVNEFVAQGDDRNFLDYVLQRYNLMTPSKGEPAVHTWRGGEQPEATLERIIGENTLRHVAFLQRGLEVARSVAFIDTGQWTGTGFLISPSLLLTNHHVIPHADLLRNTRFTFNYQQTFEGNEEKASIYVAATGGTFTTNAELDYSLVELTGEPGILWGTLQLSMQLPSVGDRVNIIQHPAGLPKQISLQNNFVEYVGSHVVQYVTSTMKGSSGSPVLNDLWKVVALHHAGGMLVEPSTERRYLRNEGIAIDAIINDLPRDLVSQISIFR